MDVSGTGILVAGSKRGQSGTGAGSCGSCFGHFHGQFIFTDIGLIVLVWGVCVCVFCFVSFVSFVLVGLVSLPCFGWFGQVLRKPCFQVWSLKKLALTTVTTCF